MAKFRIDLGIQPGIADKIDDPALRLVGLHVQLIGQHANGDALVDAAECLEDHQTGVLHELVEAGHNEKVIQDHCLALVQLQTRSLEVKVHIQALQELGDGIAVSVRFLLDHLDQILQSVAAGAVDHYGGGQITHDVRAHCLDGVQIQWLVQEHLNDEIASLGMVEEDQDRPVN